jgi:uncharacterized protein involved in type VI secretion and phage assembly
MLERDPIEAAYDERVPGGLGGRWYGVYPALVSRIDDPDGQGRVEVKLPWAPDTGSGEYKAWARLATLMAGNNRGSWFVPDVNDEVLVGFEGGDPRRPYVLGALWNGQDRAPQSMDGGGQNYLKVLRSRNGVKITLDDHDGQETCIIETPGGNKITLKDGAASIDLEDSNGNSVKLESSGITITAASKFTIDAPTIEMSAGSVSINSASVTASGVVQCTTCISSSTISSSYTPGAGNIL